MKIKKTALGVFVILASHLSADPLISGLGGSAGFGENVLQANDDQSTGAINITSVFPQGLDFFGESYQSLFVNNNGNVTLNESLSTFTPFAITGVTSNPIIAPFFADVDTRGTFGNTSPGGTSTGSNRVYWDLDTVNGIFTVTWDDVGYFDSSNDKVNAFQLRLIRRGNTGDFDIEFRYESLSWTTGDASGGVAGLGGTVARAGWSSGNGSNFAELAVSGQQSGMLALDTNPGVVTYQVRLGSICSVSPLPAQLDFGTVGLFQQATRVFTVTNNEPGNVSFNQLNFVDSNGFPVGSSRFSVVSETVTSSPIPPGGTREVVVTFTGDAFPRSRTGLLRLDGLCGDIPISLEVPVTGVTSRVFELTFEDPNLEQGVREAAGLSAGATLTNESVEGVTRLDLRDKGVTSLEGLEEMADLEIVDLRRNTFTDLGRSFEILDELSLVLIIRDFPRPAGSPLPANLQQVLSVDGLGQLTYVTYDPAELQTLDVLSSGVDPTDADNLVIFNALESRGVTIDTGPSNIAPAVRARVVPWTNVFGRHILDGNASGDVDGSIVSYLWNLDDGRLFNGAGPHLVDFPAGDSSVTLTVQDNSGVSRSTVVQVTVLPAAPGNVAMTSASSLAFDSEAGLNYEVELMTSVAEGFQRIEGILVVGDGSRKTVEIPLAARSTSWGLFRVKAVAP